MMISKYLKKSQWAFLPSVMEEVVGQIIADVPEYAATVNSCGCKPVVCENCMRKLPERCSKNYE